MNATESYHLLEPTYIHTCNYGPYYNASTSLEQDDIAGAVGHLESWLHDLDEAKHDISAKITELKKL